MPLEHSKENKKEKKRLDEKDRSKYKKSNQNKIKKESQEVLEGSLRGKVLSILSKEILVDYLGTHYYCTLRGTLKQETQKLKNLITVGDNVLFLPMPQEQGIIYHIEERISFLSREGHLFKHKEQLIASNIDQVIITSSVVYPDLKPALIDRYLIACEKGNMKPIILFNKIDLLEKEEFKEARAFFEEVKKSYLSLGYSVIVTSTTSGEGIDALKEVMQNKSSVFSGQSGTGKSSLINCMTEHNLSTNQLTKKTQKGGHTTTSTSLLPLPFGGFCIDTPGIRSFGVWSLTPEEVKYYFHEFVPYASSCRYTGCNHLHEPGCAVKAALDQGALSPLRYESYVRLYHNDSTSR